MSFNHVLLTRFNVPTRGPEKIIRASSDWLANRFDLFEKFCLPSVKAQTTPAFNWILYFDIETPGEYRERALAHINAIPQASIRFGGPDDFSPQSIENDITERAKSKSDWVLTTRLDNDDAISRDFIERIQLNARSGVREVLNIPRGFIWSEGRVYSHMHESNAFASFSEDPKTFKTVLSISHLKLGSIAPMRQIAGKEAWLQVIHGQNVSNKVRGNLTDIAAVRHQFALAENIAFREPTSRELAVDRLLMSPLRQGRDSLIDIAKTLRRGARRLRPG